MTLLISAVNAARVVAEVGDAFRRYEAALLANDLAALDAFFWKSEHTVRFGLAEHGFGSRSIAAQRAKLVPVNPQRRLGKVVVTALGEDAASVAAEFFAPDSAMTGRQTQLWARFEEGWRIVCAHVSLVEQPARSCDSER